MKILVIAGSPKGELSVTRQYVRYLANGFDEHSWEIVDVAFRIHQLERDKVMFAETIDQIRNADLVLWAFPLYVLLVPAGYKRFIELVHERGATDAFVGKYAASLSTSIHFHDHCAHDYIRAVSEDLGMRFCGVHSPEMYDLERADGRRQLLAFGRHVLRCVAEQRPVQRRNPPLQPKGWCYTPSSEVAAPLDLQGRRAVIVHDATAEQPNLLGMVERLRASFGTGVEVVNLRELAFKGNCLGCLRCGAANHCAYEGKDELIDFYQHKLMQADLLVFAGAVVDRHLSSRWRQFFERGFFRTHQPSFSDKQVAFLVAGPLSQLAALREVLVGYVQWQEANLVDVISDEEASSDALDAQLSGLARRMADASADGYLQPLDFHGVGGRLIFRDHIFGRLRPVFLADHLYYRRSGFYDFPTRRWGMRLFNLVLGLLFRIGLVRRKFEQEMKRGMVRPLEKWLAGPSASRAAAGGVGRPVERPGATRGLAWAATEAPEERGSASA